MATKTKAAGEKINGTETIETAIKNGSEAFKTGFDKAVKNYDQFLGYGKDTVEAYMKAANAAGKGVETLHNELYAYSKQSVEESICRHEGAARLQVGARGVRAADGFRQVGVRRLCQPDDEARRDHVGDGERDVRTAPGPHPGLGRDRPELPRGLIASRLQNEAFRGSSPQRGTISERARSATRSGSFAFRRMRIGVAPTWLRQSRAADAPASTFYLIFAICQTGLTCR